MGVQSPSDRKFSDEFGVGEMVIQSTVFPDEVCKEKELYFRTTGKIHQDKIWLKPGEQLSTDTYMNALDVLHWAYYTNLCLESLRLCFSGTCTVILSCLEEGREVELYRHQYSHKTPESAVIPIVQRDCPYSSLIFMDEKFLTIILNCASLRNHKMWEK